MAVVVAEPEPEEQVVAGMSLGGLAEDWESDLGIRQRARQLGSLLNWGDPKKVGISSMILILFRYFLWICLMLISWGYVIGFPSERF